MAISRVPGFSLLPNLDRQGVDLQFTTQGNALVQMDFTNFRVGINSSAPTESLSVNGNVIVSNGHVYSEANVSYDLGKITNYWRNFYVENAVISSNLTIGSGLSISGNIDTTSINADSLYADEFYEAGYRVLTSNSNIIVNGDVTGSGTNSNVFVLLNTSGVTPATYGSANAVVQLTVNDKGIITTAANVVLTRIGNLYVNDTEIYNQSGNIAISSVTGNVSVNNSRITNLATPVNNTDAVTKFYVDNSILVAGKSIFSGNSSVTVNDDNISPGWISTVVDGIEVANVTTVTTQLYNNLEVATFSISGNLLSSTGNIIVEPDYPGIVKVYGNSAIQIPAGDDFDRPGDPTEGYIRYSTSRNGIEYWDGANWQIPGEVTIISDTITPDGVSNVFILTANTSTQGVLVSINGTVQRPQSAYTVTNNAITFTETPLTTDIIEVRTLATGAAFAYETLGYDNSLIVADGVNLNVTGNLLPSANVTYSLGSASYQWKDLWVSGNTIYLGGAAITVATGQLSINGNTVGAADPYGNINVKAYTETMGFANYGNVNVAAYSRTQSFTNYSNVNVSSYLGGNISVGTITSGTWNGSIIDVTYGGTGASTSADALNNLLPSGEQTGYVLTTGGAGTYYWATAGGGGGATVGQSLSTLRQSNTATAGQTVFNLVNNLSYTPGTGQLRVYVNGVRQFPNAYTETSANVYTLSQGVNEGTEVFAEIDAFSTFNNYANLTYASNIGNILAVGLTVQSAIETLETTKAPLSSPVFTGTLTSPIVAVTSSTQSTSVTTGALVVTGGIGVGKDAFFNGNITVAGNLFINGNTTTLNTNNLSISDSLIYLATANPEDTIDIGFIGHFINPGYQHTGLVRDASDGTWKLFANVVSEPTTTVDFTDATYSNLRIGNLTAVSATFTTDVSAQHFTATGNVSSTNLTGTLLTASQPNITAVGTLGTLNVSGLTTLAETTEILDTKFSVTGTVVHDFSTSAIWYYSNIAGNVTANITNVPTTDNRVTSVSIVVNQGSPGYIVNGLQINGAAQTIRWQGNTVPAASTNRIDVFTFSLIRAASAWTVLGAATSHG